MKNILLAGLLGALVAFIWGAISWIVLPWHLMTLEKMPNEEAVVAVMKTNLDRTAVYMFPGHDESVKNDPAAMEAFSAAQKTGPNGLLFYRADGIDPMDPKQYIFGYLIAFIAASLAAMLLQLGINTLPRFSQRWMFVALLGLFASVVSHLSQWNWLAVPTDYTIVNMADLTVTWLLVGLVLAWRIRPVK